MTTSRAQKNGTTSIIAEFPSEDYKKIPLEVGRYGYWERWSTGQTLGGISKCLLHVITLKIIVKLLVMKAMQLVGTTDGQEQKKIQCKLIKDREVSQDQ